MIEIAPPLPSTDVKSADTPYDYNNLSSSFISNLMIPLSTKVLILLYDAYAVTDLNGKLAPITVIIRSPRLKPLY